MAKKFYRGWISEGSYSGETEKAICFDVDDGRYGRCLKTVLFPKSVLRWGEIDHETGFRQVFVPAWLFASKRLDPDRVMGIRWDRDMVCVM